MTERRDGPDTPDSLLLPDSTRREFIGTAAFFVAAATAPSLLHAEPQRTLEPDPWTGLVARLRATIGTDDSVEVLDPVKSGNGYTIALQTDDERTGTALAAVLRPTHRLEGGVVVTVVVQNRGGMRWPPRPCATQEEAALTVKDAFRNNGLAAGVMRTSLERGKPIVLAVKSTRVQFTLGGRAQSQAANIAIGDLLVPTLGGVQLNTAVFNRSGS